MKTSIIFIILIVFNTTALIAEPLAQLIGNLNIWFFIIIEVVLFLIYCVHTIIRDVRKAVEIEINGLDLFITKSN